MSGRACVHRGRCAWEGGRCVGEDTLTWQVYRACASWGRCREHAKGRRSASQTVRGNQWPRAPNDRVCERARTAFTVKGNRDLLMPFLYQGDQGGWKGADGNSRLKVLLSNPLTNGPFFVACGLVANVWLSGKQESRSLLTQTPVRIDITNLQRK